MSAWKGGRRSGNSSYYNVNRGWATLVRFMTGTCSDDQVNYILPFLFRSMSSLIKLP